jgi:hypothetical protein
MMKGSPRHRNFGVWATALLYVVVLALLWHQVFVTTGVLWWNAPAPGKRVPRPAPPHLPETRTDWVDLDTYLRNHPEWRP